VGTIVGVGDSGLKVGETGIGVTEGLLLHLYPFAHACFANAKASPTFMQPFATVPVLLLEHLYAIFLNPSLVFGSQGLLKLSTFTLGGLQVLGVGVIYGVAVGVVLILSLVPKTPCCLNTKKTEERTITPASNKNFVKGENPDFLETFLRDFLAIIN
jgi:hypothetical protein